MHFPSPKAALVSTATGQRVSYEGTGYFFWLALDAAAVVAVVAYFLLEIGLDPARRSLSTGLLAILMTAALLGNFFLAAREYTSSLDLTDTMLTKSNWFGHDSMHWSEIASVEESTIWSSLLLHSNSGALMRIPRFLGCSKEVSKSLSTYLPAAVQNKKILWYHELDG